MLNFRKPNPYSLVLSALTCLNFSFFADAQVKPAAPPVPRSESPAQQQQNSLARQQQSLRAQEESIARQRTAAGEPPRTLPVTRFAAAAGASSNPFDCEPVSQMILETAVHNAAQTYAVAPALIQAVIHQESGGYPCAVSEKGAMGLMQLMPDTAADMGAVEPFDVSQNVSAGTRLLSELMRRYNGDLNRVLGAYNAGASAVDRVGGTPPFPETIDYVHSILERLKLPGAPKLFASPIR